MATSSPKSAFTTAQLEAYEEFVNLPQQFRRASTPTLDLAYLTALHVAQITTIPYENLTLHYSDSEARLPDLSPPALFEKLTDPSRCRGGYCMEGSLFFGNILRAAGFPTYPVGVRIRLREAGVPKGDYIGWVHLVNIVTLPATGERFSIDVCFGGDGPTKPLPLVETRIVTQNLGTQEVRLIRDFIPGQTCLEDRYKLWIYQYRNSPDAEWNSFYAFPETEFLPNDFEVMNWFTACHADSFQKYNILIVKFLRGEEAHGGMVVTGKRMLWNEAVKENLGGRTLLLQTCATEQERIVALKDFFGMSLTPAEIASIRGSCTELKAAPLS